MYGIHYFCNCYHLFVGLITMDTLFELSRRAGGRLGNRGRLRLEFKFLEIIERDSL